MKRRTVILYRIKKFFSEKRDSIYNLEYEKISKMNEREYILNYTEIKSKYKFFQNLKYLLNFIASSLILFLVFIIYRLSIAYFINYSNFNVEQKELAIITLIVLLRVLLMLVFVFLIIIYLYLKKIRHIDRKLRIYEEIKWKNNNI